MEVISINYSCQWNECHILIETWLNTHERSDLLCGRRSHTPFCGQPIRHEMLSLTHTLIGINYTLMRHEPISDELFELNSPFFSWGFMLRTLLGSGKSLHRISRALIGLQIDLLNWWISVRTIAKDTNWTICDAWNPLKRTKCFRKTSWRHLPSTTDSSGHRPWPGLPYPRLLPPPLLPLRPS